VESGSRRAGAGGEVLLVSSRKFPAAVKKEGCHSALKKNDDKNTEKKVQHAWLCHERQCNSMHRTGEVGTKGCWKGNKG